MTIWQRFKKITLSNLCALLLYLVSGLLANTILSAISPTKTVALTVLSLLTMALFTYLLIRAIYLKCGNGEKQYLKMLRETGRAESGISVSEDCKLLLREEAGMLISFLAVNLLCWGLILLDELLLSQRTVTWVLILYAPMQMLTDVLPHWGSDFFGFLLSAVVDGVLYLLIPLHFRKKWRMQVMA